MLRILSVAAALSIAALPVSAGGSKQYHAQKSQVDVPVWSYAARANYCPGGLQPVTSGGAISCGAPNQSVTYQKVKAHGHGYRVRRAYNCPPGQKGC
ncbi:hypothetical protein SAMN04490248_10837 [Salinihabitans flavidus]|uniref:Uncharacterized protein n=1 Tax=Salinihabitans flavidus TaxID=569882 RepID=A0A1H8R8A5_9RHOB|nr:hypothetical protein [Salinihabitans flavidus]SEO62640.1 hypothetical protein SAMN04490248_10837 [Salinihabitans flavidus]